MAKNGTEKRKADEMAEDSVEVPLAELKELAEKGGERNRKTGSCLHIHMLMRERARVLRLSERHD